MFKNEEARIGPEALALPELGKSGQTARETNGPLSCHVTKKSYKVYLKKTERNRSEAVPRTKVTKGRANKGSDRTPDHPLFTMSELCSESSEEEQADVEERQQERRVTRLPIIQLMPMSKVGSPGGSPKISPKDSPRGSPRNSPLFFRKLLMNRSLNLQRRRFTLAHTPR